MLLLPLHDPLRVAEGAAVCDIVSGGRFDLGVAVGYREPEFQAFGRRVGQRGRRMDEALDVLDLAWSEDRFSYEGRYYQYQDVSLTPKPVQRPVPVWIGGWAPPVVDRAARRGLNIMGAFGEALERYARTAKEAGVDITGAQITTGGDVWVDDDEQRARDEMLPLLRYLYHEQLGGWQFLRDGEGRGVGFDRPQMLEGMVNAVISGAALGCPETVAAAIEARLAANPMANHVFCRVRFDSVPRHRLRRCMELLAREVMPRLREEVAAR
jgi:alkanesulfonate monooxygenase SsuD/methylene tetrahydromethanopterin reductase-like flavin-dependent oxidoreductase (luciferase family)